MSPARKPVSPGQAVRWCKERSFSWQLEEQSLDKIHAALARYQEGLKMSDLAEQTGLGKGYLEQLLKASDCVLKLRAGTYRWIADWQDLEGWPRTKPLDI